MKVYFNILLALLLISCNHAQNVTYSDAIVIKNVNIVDVESGSVIQNKNLIIRSGKIDTIIDKIEEGIEFQEVIDGNGNYLIPGLAEMHAHIPPATEEKDRIEDVLFLYLSNGITTIRGMLGHPLHLELRENARSGALLSPRIFTSSPSLNGNSVTSIEEAKSKVETYKVEGYDFLKIHPGIKLDVFNQIVETAKEVDIPFSGHVPVDVGIRHALISQYASIDHIDGFLEGLVPEDANVNPNDNGFFGYAFTPIANIEKIDELVALSKENKVWIVPTQSLFTRWFAPISSEELLSQPEMKYMPKSTLDNWDRVKKSSMADGSFDEAQWMRFDSIRKILIKKLYEHGHGMLLGSDAPQLFNVPGFSIHHEMAGMQEAGLNPSEILKTGTINPALFFGKEDEFGTIKEGLAADLILLNSNPLESLEALKNPLGVMVKGQWLSRSEIDKKLAEIAEKLSKD